MGFLSVAMFFFLSGYGLQISRKRENYILSMPFRRILPFYINCIILIIIYALFNGILYGKLSIISILKSLTWGGTIISNGWYLQAILVLYIMFWLINSFVKESRLEIVLLVALIVCYCFICNVLKMGSTVYESIPAFILGCIWCEKKNGIDRILKKYWNILVMVFFLTFCVTLIMGMKILTFKMMSAICFVVFINVLLFKISISCMLTKFIGKYYFEIYVTQGMALSFFHSSRIYIANPWLYILLCCVTTALLSFALHPLFQTVNLVFKKKKIS